MTYFRNEVQIYEKLFHKAFFDFDYLRNSLWTTRMSQIRPSSSHDALALWISVGRVFGAFIGSIPLSTVYKNDFIDVIHQFGPLKP